MAATSGLEQCVGDHCWKPQPLLDVGPSPPMLAAQTLKLLNRVEPYSGSTAWNSAIHIDELHRPFRSITTIGLRLPPHDCWIQLNMCTILTSPPSSMPPRAPHASRPYLAPARSRLHGGTLAPSAVSAPLAAPPHLLRIVRLHEE